MKKKPLLKIGKRRDKDPTQTLTLRNEFIRILIQSFSKIKSNLKELIIKNDFLSAQKITTNEKKYTYEYAAQKIDDFDKWLVSQIENNVLYTTLRPELIPMGQNWWGNTYIYSAYQKGIYQARADLNNVGVKLPELGSIVAEMNKPFHAERVALLYTRAFNGMKGVTNAMRTQMNHVLATGMAEGKGPYSIAYDLTNRIDKIGITRARLIARTETIYAHNSAILNEYSSLEGIVGEEIKVQWWTALDERVRAQHRQWHGNVYTQDQARGMLGAPACRCTVLPYTETLAKAREKFDK